MSEQQTTNNNNLIENAKKVSRYMRDTLEELKKILDGDPLKNAKEETPPGVTVTPPAAIETPPTNESTIETGLFGGELPLIYGKISESRFAEAFIPDEGNGRDEPLPYLDPLENGDQDLVDVLDCDVVARIDAAPQDQLDIELHVESCPTCQVNYFKLCAHCLEPKVCTEEPIELRRTQVLGLYAKDQADELVYFARLPLCRVCKRDAERDRSLLLEE